MALHEWAFASDAWRATHGLEGGVETASSAVIRELHAGVGATVMGRNMFGGGHGPWATDPAWDGWWGEEPPYHHPVFVLTHHPRPPLELIGTTFTFVTDGFASAVAQARAAAGDLDVQIGGGADTIRQALAAGVLDQLDIHIAPVMLGSGERLFGGTADVRLEQERVIAAPGVTHLRYRVLR
jgi:dihydrofolate reductase